jgi:hypothetical protein
MPQHEHRAFRHEDKPASVKLAMPKETPRVRDPEEGRNMRFRVLLLVGIGLAFGPAPARAVDLSQIDRVIAREPAYRNKTPLYSLLVFGPTAQTRVWLILDGTDLYVDTDGNGDLTAAGKCFPRDGADFKPFEIKDRDGKERYMITSIGVFRTEKEPAVLMANVEIAGKYKQYSDSAPAARLRDAPISHFHGPLQLGLRARNWVCHEKLVAGAKTGELFAWIGTFDKANGCWVVVSNTVIDRPDKQRKDFPTDIHPVVEVEFPPKQPGGKPIRERYELRERC